MICSRCKRDLPKSQFSPKRFSQTTHIIGGKEKTYRNRCRRGRHYNCHECRRAAWKKKRTKGELVSASSNPRANANTNRKASGTIVDP